MMMATAGARGKDFRDGASTETGQSENVSRFWQVWLEEEDKLYGCCLSLMNFNHTEAEDALGEARLKAWKKVQELGDSIRNLTAWLMKLTSNLCKDILKKESTGPVAVENIELVGETGDLCMVSSLASPQMVLESEERDVVIRRAVASLSPGMRDTFVLHYYEGLEYTEIAERLGLTYDSVCKRISRARQELKGKLRGYFRDEEELEKELEPVGSKSRRKKAQVDKQKIGSSGKSPKKTATVSAAGKCGRGVVEGKSSAKNGAAEQKALAGSQIKEEVRAKGSPEEHSPSRLEQVEDLPIQSVSALGKETVTVSAAGNGTSVEEKGEVVSGAVAQARTLKGPATRTKCSLLSSPHALRGACSGMRFRMRLGAHAPGCAACAGYITCIIDASGDQLQVSAPLGEKIEEVCALGRARSRAPTPVASSEKLPIRLGEELSQETVAVSAAGESTSVGEKPSLLSGGVPRWAIWGEKIKEVCAKGRMRSHPSTPVASSEKLPIQLGEELPTETVAVSAAGNGTSVGEKPSLFSGAVALLGEKIKEVCALGLARSRAPTPPAISGASGRGRKTGLSTGSS